MNFFLLFMSDKIMCISHLKCTSHPYIHRRVSYTHRCVPYMTVQNVQFDSLSRNRYGKVFCILPYSGFSKPSAEEQREVDSLLSILVSSWEWSAKAFPADGLSKHSH